MQKPYISHCSGAAGRTGEGALKALNTLEITNENVHIWSMDRLVQAGPGGAPAWARAYSDEDTFFQAWYLEQKCKKGTMLLSKLCVECY